MKFMQRKVPMSNKRELESHYINCNYLKQFSVFQYLSNEAKQSELLLYRRSYHLKHVFPTFYLMS